MGAATATAEIIRIVLLYASRAALGLGVLTLLLENTRRGVDLIAFCFWFFVVGYLIRSAVFVADFVRAGVFRVTRSGHFI